MSGELHPPQGPEGSAIARVLVVEDSELFYQVARGLLAQHRIEARAASTIQEGQKLFTETAFDLLLVDIYLHESSGLDFCRWARSQDPELPIVLMTAHPEGLDLAGLLGPVADDFFVKTSGLTELVGRIQARLSQHSVLRRIRTRELLLQKLVAIGHLLNVHQDLDDLCVRLGDLLLDLPSVCGAYISVLEDESNPHALMEILVSSGISAEPPPEVVDRVLSENSSLLHGMEEDSLEIIPLGHGPFGVLSLRRQRGAGLLDESLRAALGGLVANALAGARQYAVLKDRQARLERGFLERSRESVRMAERLTRLAAIRDNFLRIMSHDLRSPISVILGVTQLLDEELLGKLNPKQKTNVEVLRRHGERLQRMIEEMLDRRRSFEAAVPIVLEPVECAPFILEELDKLQPLAASREQRLRAELEASIQVDGDLPSLREMVSTLIDNALCYGRQGGEILVSLERQGNNAMLAISDDGPGYSLSESTGGSPFFSDMNLRFALGTVRAHGGTCKLENRSSGGGLARVLIPLSTGLGDQLDVLVASADLERIEEVETELGRYWTVSCVTNTADLLGRIRANSPGVLVLDHQLVGNPSGPALVGAIKDDPRFAEIPIVFIAPSDRRDLAEKARTRGALAALFVPLDVAQLVNEVRQAARKASPHGELPARLRDPLTGFGLQPLATARKRRLQNECSKAGISLSSLRIALRGADTILEQHGRTGLDHLLLFLSRILREELLAGEPVYRLDDTSFLVLLPRVGFEEAEQRAHGIQERIRNSRPRVGIVRITFDIETDVKDLLRQDTCLESAQQYGTRESRSTWRARSTK